MRISSSDESSISSESVSAAIDKGRAAQRRAKEKQSQWHRVDRVYKVRKHPASHRHHCCRKAKETRAVDRGTKLQPQPSFPRIRPACMRGCVTFLSHTISGLRAFLLAVGPPAAQSLINPLTYHIPCRSQQVSMLRIERGEGLSEPVLICSRGQQDGGVHCHLGADLILHRPPHPTYLSDPRRGPLFLCAVLTPSSLHT